MTTEQKIAKMNEAAARMLAEMAAAKPRRVVCRACGCKRVGECPASGDGAHR